MEVYVGECEVRKPNTVKVLGGDNGVVEVSIEQIAPKYLSDGCKEASDHDPDCECGLCLALDQCIQQERF